MKNRPAKGTRGCIIRTIDGGCMFRVYFANHEFIDYDILHYDMEVEIIDDDATFYDGKDIHVIDHAPLYKTLDA